MDARPYWYFVPYTSDAASALAALRQREFEAGRYNPRMRRVEFDEPAFSPQHPGPGHATIAKAVAASFDEGTRSILDIAAIAAGPTFGAACPMGDAALEAAFGTRQPTRELVLPHLAQADREGASSPEWLDALDRGQCFVVTIYADGAPSELLFVGITIG